MSNSDERALATVRAAKARNEQRLLALPGVHGVGVGRKEVAGKETGEYAIVVLVDEKRPRSALTDDELVPGRFRHPSPFDDVVEDVATDVRARARPTPCPHVDRAQLLIEHRPAPAGVIIAVAEGGGSGTLGGWLIDERDGEYVFLSNKHVLGSITNALISQPVFSPTGEDHSFGRVKRASTTLDATIGRPIDVADVLPEIYGGGPAIYETAQAVLSMQVEKTGASTGHTYGTVDMIDFTTSRPCVAARNAISIRAEGDQFTQQGDSGSVIMERTHPEGRDWKRAVGLLYCMSDAPQSGVWGYAHQIQTVMADLELETLCEAVARVIGEWIDAL